MQRYFLLLSMLVILVSCGKDKEKEELREQYVEDSIAKAEEEKRFRESRERIEPNPEPKKENKIPTKQSLLNSLPGKWILLGVYRQQKVVFIPCGAEEAPYFNLQEINGTSPKIFFKYGDELKTYFIANIEKQKDVFNLNLVRYYEEEEVCLLTMISSILI